MSKKKFEAVFDDNGEKIVIKRKSDHDYKFAWMVKIRMYGWKIVDGKKEEYDNIYTPSGFSSKQIPISNHGYESFDISGNDWKNNPYERHGRVLWSKVVQVNQY